MKNKYHFSPILFIQRTNKINKEMKKLYLTFLIFISLLAGLKAQSIGYGYDAAGNRISRYIITTKDAVENDTAPQNNPQEFKLDSQTKTLIYPNPTAGLLNFKITSPGNEENLNIRVKVYTVSGNLIVDEVFHSGRFNVDITHQPNGTYLLDLQVNNKKQAFTIIKE